MLLGECFSRLLAISGFLLFPRETATQPLQFLLSFAVVPGVVYGLALGVGQETLETYIDADLLAGCNMVYIALNFDTELAIEAIGTTDDTNPFDILHRKGLDVLFLVSNQAESANSAAIGEGDIFAIIIQLPSSLLVLNRAVIVLKLRIAFLPWLVLSTIGIETINSEPSTISTGLTSLGLWSTGKGKLKRQDSAIGLQVVFVDTIAIHPQAYAFIADELHNTYRLFNACLLFLIAIKLVLVDQHASYTFLEYR